MGKYVSIVKSGDSVDEIRDAVYSSLSMIEYNKKENVKTAVIKPNLCYYWDSSTGYTTNPLIVEVLIDWIRDIYGSDVNIKIAESDASAMRTKYAFTMLGYEKLAKKKNVELFNLSNDDLTSSEILINGKKIKFNAPNTLLHADLFINVPKLKVMKDVKITCALKNIFGCIANRRKILYHKKLNETIVGVNKIIQPHLTVVDGLVALGKHPIKMDLIVASEDPYSVDWVASEIMGINPNSVGAIKLGQKEGIWSKQGLKIFGEDPKVYGKNFPKLNRFTGISWAIQLTLLKLYIIIVGDAKPHLIE